MNLDRLLVAIGLFFVHSHSFKTWTHILSRQRRPSSFLPQMSIDINDLFEGDIIVLEGTNNRPRSLAAVTSSKKSLQPLCVRTSSGIDEVEEGGSTQDIVLYEDEECEPIAMDMVLLNADAVVVEDVVFTQRCVEDRVSNPHGEHAEGM